MAEAKPKLASQGQATLAIGTLRPTQDLASARPLRASTFGALQSQIQRLSRGSGSLLATLVGDLRVRDPEAYHDLDLLALIFCRLKQGVLLSPKAAAMKSAEAGNGIGLNTVHPGGHRHTDLDRLRTSRMACLFK